MDPNNPYVAVMNPRARLMAQEQMAGVQPIAQPQIPNQMPQAQFSGYGVQPPSAMPGRPPMTPQQIQQLAALLQARQQ